MINILIDCANKEIRVTADGEEYFHAKPEHNLATTTIVAWQIAHDLSHKFEEKTIKYFGVTPDNRNINLEIDIAAQAFCMLLDNFGSTENLVTTQTNLGIQLLIHGAHQQEIKSQNDNK